MDIKQFLSQVLPSTGEYYVLGGKSSLRTSTAKTIDGAEALINRHKMAQENVYVGLAGFRAGTSRKKQDITGKKCFYLDIDIDPSNSKKYPSKGDAARALVEFLRASHMPVPTMIVDSGGGLHVYWVLTEVVTEAEWTSIANGIKRLTTEHGFKADAAITADSARIMRVPGTFNWKEAGHPRECKVIKNTGHEYLVADIRKVLPKGSNVIAMPGMEKFAGSGFDSIIATSSQPRYMKHILKECKTAHNTHITGGAGDDYNQWFAMLTLLLFCEDGDGFVHPFSNKHASYNSRAVAAKWQSRLDDKAASNVHGATTCESFHALNPAICEACPHWASPDRGVSWSSPLYFGLPAPAADLPAPFMYLSNGNTGFTSEDADGNKIIEEAFHGQVHELKVYESEIRTLLYWEHHLPSKAVRVVEVDALSLVDPKAFKKALLDVPLVFTDAEAKRLRIMTESWVKRIQNRKGEISAPASHGWTRDGARVGFRHGDIVYWNDGKEQVVHTSADSGLRPIGTKGTFEGWKKMVVAAMQADHIETEVLIAAAFAAPLIDMTHIEGAILSAVSLESGTGKTTAMKLGQAVWGDPKTAMFSLSDTANSILSRMGNYGNLPAMWDDIRIPDNQRDAQQKVDMIYQLTQGREKARMTQSAEMRHIASWCTLLVCTSNNGLSTYINMIDQGGSAAHHRMLEFNVSPLNTRKACDAMAFSDMRDHYGHAGAIYAKWLLNNYSSAKNILINNISAISHKIGARPEDRFTMTTIAAIYTAAMFAERAGIVTFNKAGMLKFLIDAFRTHRKEIKQSSRSIGADNNIVEILGTFMAEHQMNTAVMKYYPRPGRGDMQADNLISPADRETFLSVAVEDREIRILRGKLDKWFKVNGRLSAQRELLAVPGVSCARRNIGGFTTGASKALNCYAIEMTPETEMLFGEYNIPAIVIGG